MIDYVLKSHKKRGSSWSYLLIYKRGGRLTNDFVTCSSSGAIGKDAEYEEGFWDDLKLKYFPEETVNDCVPFSEWPSDDELNKFVEIKSK